DRDVGPVRDDPLAELDPVHPAHVQVGEDDVEVSACDEIDGLGGRGGPAHVEPFGRDAGGDRLAHRLPVVDDEDAARHDAASIRPLPSPVGCGRKIEKRLPSPATLATSIHPPCSLTMPWATARPRPVPSPGDLVVKNGSKMRPICSGDIPWPTSVTVTKRY